MGLQKSKSSIGAKGMRLANKHLDIKGIAVCENCNRLKIDHLLCKSCFTYNKRNYSFLFKKEEK